jgi:hypothetical protein
MPKSQGFPKGFRGLMWFLRDNRQFRWLEVTNGCAVSGSRFPYITARNENSHIPCINEHVQLSITLPNISVAVSSLSFVVILELKGPVMAPMNGWRDPSGASMCIFN